MLRTDGGRAVEIRSSDERITIPVPSVAVVDTVGAGDAFGGGFLAAWSAAARTRDDVRQLDVVAEAVRFAVRVASLTCTRPGVDPPTRAELDASAPGPAARH